ncbi:DUF2889 domain-containing protein [Bordetella sp. FB-8]|uniref:DUF2889 domain-containing protein n=1 Tax=Bordetella sp. FB-8 TaxID=1159870 RepID=UPI00038155B2|nr:DUF2889 domain-containing protein [Bordetella sp. FB-8]
MSLSKPETPRKLLHTRSIRVQAYEREDGLMDLEAELVDFKGYDFHRIDGMINKAGEHVHDMTLRVTIDADYTIVDAQASYAAAPYGASCMAITPAYRDLVGMNLLKNFRRQVKERFARTAGCTHMTELSQVLPTAAVQANAGARRKQTAQDVPKRPFQLDGCHALSTDGSIALKYYPRWYTGRHDGEQNESVAAVSPDPSP